MKNNLYLVPIALLICSILIMYDFQKVYAISVTEVSYGATNDSIVRGGNYIFVGSVGSDNVQVYNANSPHALVSTISSITNPQQLYVNSDASRVYAFGDNLYEIDTSLHVVLRTLAHGCAGAVTYIQSTNTLYCATTPLTANTIKTISTISMSVTATSASVNAGGSPCNQITGIDYITTGDKMILGCDVNNVVAIINGFTVSATPDYSIAFGDPDVVVYSDSNDNLLACGQSTASIIFNDTGSALASWKTLDTYNCGGSETVVHHDASQRYIIADGTTKSVLFFDSGTGLLLGDVLITVGSYNSQQISPFTNTLLYGAEGTGTNWFVLDSTGISLGTGGEPDTPSTGIDCTLPENANILICRLGSDPSCNGTVLSCVGNTVIGNSTDDSDTGLIDVICGVGFIDCNANPDIKTNGIGYLLLAVALGIEIGILWVASRGDLRQVPTFIWFIATIAIITALTLFNWIDATMLVLGVIVAVALASAKARGFFGGDSF